MSSTNRRLLIATGSAHKFEELRELLDLSDTELVSLADVGISDSAEETGETFAENASAKAIYYASASGLPALADDSGVEVDALDGRPGVRTRRYAGPNATDAQNNALLLSEMYDVGRLIERTARYQCVLAFAATDDGEPTIQELTQGTFEGRIAFEPRGTGGFGYDPLFEPLTEPEGGRTVGELSAVEKNAVSHRAKAARQMRERLLLRDF